MRLLVEHLPTGYSPTEEEAVTLLQPLADELSATFSKRDFAASGAASHSLHFYLIQRLPIPTTMYPALAEPLLAWVLGDPTNYFNIQLRMAKVLACLLKRAAKEENMGPPKLVVNWKSLWDIFCKLHVDSPNSHLGFKVVHYLVPHTS